MSAKRKRDNKKKSKPKRRSNRDDFSKTTVRILGDQVGWHCSDPGCRAQCRGPHTDPSKSVSVGIGGHIKGAAPKGPRYDPNQTPEQRKSAENGIYLCAIHGKVVDSDQSKHTVEQLREWKRRAIERADNELGKPALDRPLLQLSIFRHRDAADWNYIGGGGRIVYGTKARFYHLNVSNAHRATAQAHNVHVLLVRIDHQDASGTFKPVWQGDAARIWWRYEREDPHITPKRTVGPDLQLDLMFLEKDPPVLHQPSQTFRRAGAPQLSLRLAFLAAKLEPFLAFKPNRPVILHVQAQGDETDSEVFRVKVEWDGQWSDDDAEMERHLTCEAVEGDP